MSPILVGPLAVAGISTVLAFIIALLDKFLNNYGQLNVSINGGKKSLSVKGGSPLLGTLAAEGIFVPSRLLRGLQVQGPHGRRPPPAH